MNYIMYEKQYNQFFTLLENQNIICKRNNNSIINNQLYYNYEIIDGYYKPTRLISDNCIEFTICMGNTNIFDLDITFEKNPRCIISILFDLPFLDINNISTSTSYKYIDNNLYIEFTNMIDIILFVRKLIQLYLSD